MLNYTSGDCRFGHQSPVQKQKFVLFRGDDTDFLGNQTLMVVIDTTLDISACKAHFACLGYRIDYDTIPANKTLELVFPASVTRSFPLGVMEASLVIEDTNQKVRTVENRIRISVTSSVSEAYDNESNQAITVSLKCGTVWESITNKPNFTSLNASDMKLSSASIKEYLVTLEGLLKTAFACFSLVFILPCFATGYDISNNVMSISTKLGYVDGDRTTVGDVVGLVTPEGIGALPDSTVIPSTNGFIKADAVTNKADKATTLSGYGITDALKDDVESLTNSPAFTNAVAKVSPPTILPSKWAFGDVTNANGEAVTAADVGARPSDWMPTAAEVGARPNVWMPNAQDVGARPDDWMPTAADVGALEKEWQDESYGPSVVLLKRTYSNVTSPLFKATETPGPGSTTVYSWYAEGFTVPWSRVTGAPAIPTDSTVAGWGYIKSWTETDPTVPAWAKENEKPTYTAAEVGARPNDWMPNAQDVGALPVGEETLKTTPAFSNAVISTVDPLIPRTAADVGAMSDTYQAPVSSVNSKTGAVALVAEDIPLVGPRFGYYNNVQSWVNMADSFLGTVPPPSDILIRESMTGRLGLYSQGFSALDSLYIGGTDEPHKAAVLGDIPTDAHITDLAAVEVADLKEYVDAKDYIVSGAKTYVETPVVNGYAFSVMRGDGMRCYFSLAPSFNGRIVVSHVSVESDELDPMCRAFGASIPVKSSDMTFMSLRDYTESGFEGYCAATAKYSTDNIEFVFDKNLLGAGATFSGITSYECYSDSITFHFDSTTPVDGVLSYYAYGYIGDELIDGQYSTRVSFEDANPNDYAGVTFGSLSAFVTSDQIDTARSELVMRTGKRDELGYGPGYKIYNFKNDERKWQLTVPSVGVATYSDSRNNEFCFEGFIMVNISGLPDLVLPADNTGTSIQCPFGASIAPQLIDSISSKMRVVSTFGSRTDRCDAMNSVISFLPFDTNRLAVCNYAFNVAVSNDYAAGVRSYAVVTNANLSGGGTYMKSLGNQTESGLLYTIHNFDRNLSISRTGMNWYGYSHNVAASGIGATFEMVLSDQVFVKNDANGFTAYIPFTMAPDNIPIKYTTASGQKDAMVPFSALNRAPFSGNVGIHVSATAGVTITVEERANRIINDTNSHLFWDDGTRSTWELKMRDGCLSVEAVSNRDFRYEDL